MNKRFFLATTLVITTAAFVFLSACNKNTSEPPVSEIGSSPTPSPSMNWDIPDNTSTPEVSTPVTTPDATPSTTPDGSQTPSVTVSVTEAGSTAKPSASPTVAPSAKPSANPNATPVGVTDGTDIIVEGPKLTYDEYRNINDDVVGWVTIKDTNVNYPIVHSHDNEEYLSLSVIKEQSKAGAIFMDRYCEIDDNHVIIHGHNMSKSKIMFAQLTNYGNRSFFNNHRTFTVKFEDTTYTYRVFSVYTVDVGEADFYKFNFSDDAAFAEFMNEVCAANSQFPVDTTINEDDHVITLSTCSHTGSRYSDRRFVVHAVRVGEGE